MKIIFQKGLGAILLILNVFLCPVFLLGQSTPGPGALAAPLSLEPVADTFVRAGKWADVNWGGKDYLSTYAYGDPSSTKETLLRFDLGSVDFEVSSAVLRLTLKSYSPGRDISLYFTGDDSWGERSVTFNTRPVKGALIASQWLESAVVEVEVTDEVLREMGGDRMLSLYVTSGRCYNNFYSRESVVPTLRPQLILSTLLPDNVPPVIVSEPVTSVTLDESAGGSSSYVYQVAAVDADGDSVSFALESAPAGMVIDSETGLISWEPQFEDLGDHSVVVVAADGRGGVDRQVYTVSVVPPELDLAVSSVILSGEVLDPVSQILTGEISFHVTNNSAIRIAGGYDVIAYTEDKVIGGLTVIGEEYIGETILSGEERAYSFFVSGSVVFRDSPVYILIDSSFEIDEWNEDNNMASTVTECRMLPPSTGNFNPVVEWAWNSSAVNGTALNVMMTPVVMDMNGDKVPDIVFASTASTGGSRVETGFLRAISGDGSGELFTVDNSNYYINTCSSVAAGDIDGDGLPEIIACDNTGQRLIAFENNGTFKWRSPYLYPINWGAPSIADMDLDGTPEIVIGAQVLNNRGELLYSGSGNVGSVGPGPISLVADVNLDGFPEIVAGSMVYNNQGSIIRDSGLGDGLNAIGNFDSDAYPEIVLVRGGSVYLIDDSGSLLWGPISIPGGGTGGPPTVADFDGDGMAEIGVAGANNYSVFDTNGTVLWSTLTQDQSSNVTGSSVFDFEGDGMAEVVYSDEIRLYIYSGKYGETLFSMPLSSCTWHEYPVIADVDNDNNAEIVVVANNNCNKGPQRGIYVIGDSSDSWVNTRKIWNQHSYHVTNVNDDGSIPRFETNSWLDHNSYRCNVSADALACEDYSASRMRTDTTSAPDSVEIFVRIGNAGVLPLSQPLSVSFYNGDPHSGGTLLGTRLVQETIPSGSYRDVSFSWNHPPQGSLFLYAVCDDDGTGHGRIRELDENNNITYVILDL